MKYCVYISELRYGSVHVGAGSEEQARELLIAADVGPEELRHMIFMKN